MSAVARALRSLKHLPEDSTGYIAVAVAVIAVALWYFSTRKPTAGAAPRDGRPAAPAVKDDPEDPAVDTFTVRVRLPTASAPVEVKINPKADVAALNRRIGARFANGAAVAVLSGVPPRALEAGSVVEAALKPNEIVVARVKGATNTVAKAAPGAAPPGQAAGSGSVTEIKSTEQFDRIVRASPKVVVDFHATWCGPCKAIAPEIERIAGTNRHIAFVKVDVEEVEDVAMRYKITAMPTLLFLENGKEKERVQGANMPAIRDAIAKL